MDCVYKDDISISGEYGNCDRMTGEKEHIMRIAFVDDEKEYLKIIEATIKRLNLVLYPEFYKDSNEFENAMIDKKFDAIFLDIEMPELNGIDLARKLHKLGNDTPIVFLTNRDDAMDNAFGINVLAFIKKKNLSKDLPTIIQKIDEEIALNRSIFLKTSDGMISIMINSIVYCEILGRKLYLYNRDGQSYQIYDMNLNELYEKIDNRSFIYVNRSVFVNISSIYRIDKEKVFLKKWDNPLYLSRSKNHEVHDAYEKYVMSL